LTIKGVVLISNFRLVLNVVCFLLGNSPVGRCEEFFIPTYLWRWNRVFRNVGI